MWIKFRHWLNTLSLTDPIERQQAPLLQIALFSMIVLLACLIPSALNGLPRDGQLLVVVTWMVVYCALAAAVWALRRGRFELSVRIGATILVLLIASRLLAIGLEGNAALLLGLAVPITLAGLLGKRTTLLWIAGLCVTVVIGIAVLALLRPAATALGVDERSGVVRAMMTFIAVTIFLVLIVDRFGGALRTSLALALRRGLELEQLQAGLEVIVEKRTAELQIANTELQRAKHAADGARQVAEEANQFKTQFLANMSHELRTPLNAIINFTDFLSAERYGTLTERQQELQQRVLNNAEHLLGLINDILDLAKIEAGRMELFHEPTDLAQMLRSVMATTSGLTKDKGLALDLEMPDDLPIVMIDKTRIRQVLLNLLSNAAKFTEQGGITLRAVPTIDGFVQIAVQDTGIGIASEHQYVVFEEFRQVDGELTRQHQGTGLGLPISKRLVEMHGGRMWLESTPGVGTTFSFTVPAHSALPAPQEIPIIEAVELATAPLVVIVDDDPAAQQILYHHLGTAGYAVRVVSDSRKALTTIEQLQPQLILLDIQMPNKDGWEVLTDLRMTPTTAAIPVVLCSMIDEQRLGLALGANDYLVKPVRAEHLLPAIRRWLGPAAKVLVIDDDRESRQILRAILEQAQYSVHEAASGEQGLMAVEAVDPDLIVLDLMMPEMDGFQVLAQLRADTHTAALPVIVVTAKDLTAQEQAWLRQRAQLAIQKSQLTPIEFVAQLDSLTRKEPSHVN